MAFCHLDPSIRAKFSTAKFFLRKDGSHVQNTLTGVKRSFILGKESLPNRISFLHIKVHPKENKQKISRQGNFLMNPDEHICKGIKTILTISAWFQKDEGG